jgi:hypothetical protein
VKCCATRSLSEKNVVKRCVATASWPSRRSVGNLKAVGSASTNLFVVQLPPTRPDDKLIAQRVNRCLPKVPMLLPTSRHGGAPRLQRRRPEYGHTDDALMAEDYILIGG